MKRIASVLALFAIAAGFADLKVGTTYKSALPLS